MIYSKRSDVRDFHYYFNYIVLPLHSWNDVYQKSFCFQEISVRRNTAKCDFTTYRNADNFRKNIRRRFNATVTKSITSSPANLKRTDQVERTPSNQRFRRLTQPVSLFHPSIICISQQPRRIAQQIKLDYRRTSLNLPKSEDNVPGSTLYVTAFRLWIFHNGHPDEFKCDESENGDVEMLFKIRCEIV